MRVCPSVKCVRFLLPSERAELVVEDERKKEGNVQTCMCTMPLFQVQSVGLGGAGAGPRGHVTSSGSWRYRVG